MTDSAAQQQVMATPEIASEGPVLAILSGLHSGVRLILEHRDYRIGTTAGADIILRDAGIAAEHAELRVGRRAIELHAVGGDITLDDTVLAHGHGCTVRPPFHLTIGEARLQIDAAPRRGPDARSRAPFLIAGATLFAVLLLWVMAPRLGIRVAPLADRSMTTASATASTGTQGAAATTTPAVTAAEVKTAAQGLSEHLAAARLRGLAVTADGDHVAVTGSIAKSQTADWTQAQQWFDDVHGGRIIVAAKVGIDGAAATPILNVQAVWFGPRPYLITTEGTRYYKGAFLDGGWVIQDIEHGRIILAKSGETVALAYSLARAGSN